MLSEKTNIIFQLFQGREIKNSSEYTYLGVKIVEDGTESLKNRIQILPRPRIESGLLVQQSDTQATTTRLPQLEIENCTL